MGPGLSSSRHPWAEAETTDPGWGECGVLVSLHLKNLNRRKQPDLIMARLNSDDKINRNRQYAAATDQLALAFGRLQMAVGGKCLYFLKRWR